MPPLLLIPPLFLLAIYALYRTLATNTLPPPITSYQTYTTLTVSTDSFSPPHTETYTRSCIRSLWAVTSTSQDITEKEAMALFMEYYEDGAYDERHIETERIEVVK